MYRLLKTNYSNIIRNSVMQLNELSFSIPNWHKEEIKSINFAEEEIFYVSSPYNLNDFKTEFPSVNYIFSPNEEISQLPDFSTKRQFNPAVKKQIAIFVVFLWEIIISDIKNIQNSVNIGTRPSISSSQWLQSQNSSELLNIFKQPIYLLDLCKLTQIPKPFLNYYKNQIIKKILFQYIGKCIYNISLIEFLLLNNEMLRFSIELFVKAAISVNSPMVKFIDQLAFDEGVKHFLMFFEYSMTKAGSANNVFQKYFTFENNELRTEHFLLKNNSGKVYLYKKRIQCVQEKDQNQKTIQIPQFQQKSIERLILEQKEKQIKRSMQSKRSVKRKQQKDDGFLSCFSCFRQ